MRMTLHPVNLPLTYEFRISREAIANQPSLIVELEHNGVSGYGEVTENRFYGHTFASMTRSLEKSLETLDDYIDGCPRELWSRMNAAVDGDMFALSALDMAAHDLRGKRLKTSTWKDWGLNWKSVPPSSYTIGIDSIEKMVAKLEHMSGWTHYKIKLGTSHDLDIVQELRKHTHAIFRVDANCGWSADETIANSHALANLGVEFIEQPLSIDASIVDKRRVFVESALPIIADEDCQTQQDVHRCDGFYHGVNVKICKCGGLSPALNMLLHARELGMKTMIGCMVESSIGISGAAQLLPLLNYADLDGAVLLRDEPASGVKIVKGVVRPASRFGNGGELHRERLQEFRVLE